MKKKIKMIIVLFFITQAGISPALPNPQYAEYNFKKHLFIETIYEKAFTKELFKQALIYAEIKHPGIAYKQAILETADFTSELCRYANNYFGMRLPKSRCTSAVGEYKNHAQYNHWWNSVMDYKYWQDYYYEHGWNMENYLTFLHGVQYATDDYYIVKLQNLDII